MTTTEVPPAAHRCDRETTSGYAPELLVWLSPAFPTGSFAYSQGLEGAVDQGSVSDEQTLRAWLETLVDAGAIWTDTLFVALAVRAETDDDAAQLNALALALQPSAERYAETTALGANFRAALADGWPDAAAACDRLSPDAIAYAVAVGRAARAAGATSEMTADAFANASVANMLSAAIRLSIVGQTGASRIHAAVMPRIADAARRAAAMAPSDVASVTVTADLASMAHETQTVRLFQS
ncbi:MAG: urease accessory UreF family protein [Pseudomonadota bacterium]